jgi:hypothetical protein
MTDPSVEESLVDVVARFRAAGFVADFSAADGRLRCGRCGGTHEPEGAEIIDVARFEGQSDPDDEAVVFALRCSHCGTMGTLVAAYGPAASSDESDVLARLGDARWT